MTLLSRVLWGSSWGWLKATAALIGVTFLCRQGQTMKSSFYPGAGAILEVPERYEGKTTVFPPSEIAEGGRNSFLLTSQGLRVHAPGAWQAGEMVTVRGTVRRGAIQAEHVARHPGYAWKRGVLYAISLPVILALGIILLRKTRLDRGLFESRY